MVNKRIVLGILIIAFIGVTAAGTWANFTKSATSDGNTLQAGTIDISVERPNINQPFSVRGMIPDSTENIIKFYPCFWEETNKYHVTIRNTGNIPASLFISDVLTPAAGAPASIADHVTLYYSETETSDPIEITDQLVDTGFNLAGNGGSKTLYFWYSYENDGNQNAEMGKTVNAAINFELRNPDSSVPPSGI